MTNFEEILKSIVIEELQIVSSDFLDEMIENIGSTDPILRDKLIYTAFWTLISREHLDKYQLEYILNKLLEKKLLVKNIEQPTSDDVFTRSFTSLVYAAILEYDANKQTLDVDIVRKVMDTTHEYMTKENDLRGYVENKGWAHAAAHGADLLDSLIKHPIATEDDAKKVLQHLARFLTIANGYQDNEEERLSYAFVKLTKHHLQESAITNWLLELHQLLVDKQANANGALQPYYAELALKNFLKSTYFLLEKEDSQKEDLKETIKQLVIKSLY